MRKPPCKGCDRRTTEPNCHTDCAISEEGGYGYPEYARERRAYLDKKRKAKKVENYHIDSTLGKMKHRR